MGLFLAKIQNLKLRLSEKSDHFCGTCKLPLTLTTSCKKSELDCYLASPTPTVLTSNDTLAESAAAATKKNSFKYLFLFLICAGSCTFN